MHWAQFYAGMAVGMLVAMGIYMALHAGDDGDGLC